MPLDRSLAEIFGAHGDSLKADIRKCLPATVTAVHPATQTVDVQIAINNVLFDELGTAISEPAASLTDVPLGVLRGGGFLVWLPVQVGDSVLLVFSDLSTDSWRAGDGQPHDPAWVGRHDASGPFAIPMVAPDAKALASPNTDPGKIIIGKDGATAQIRISDTDIELGAPATVAVALSTKIDALINVLVATYTPSGAETGFASLVTALATFKTTYWTASTTVGSSLVKSG